MEGALLIVAGIEVLEGTTSDEKRHKAWFCTRDGCKGVHPKIDGSNDTLVNLRLFFWLGVDDFDHIARSTRNDPHTINALPRHFRLNLNRESRRHKLPRLFIRTFPKGLNIVDQDISALLFVLVAGELGTACELFRVLVPLFESLSEGFP